MSGFVAGLAWAQSTPKSNSGGRSVSPIQEPPRQEQPSGNRPVDSGSSHRGPAVAPAADGAGPARFVKPLLSSFPTDSALEVVRFVDRFYREPGNDGFEATLDEVERRLRRAGLGETGGDGSESPKDAPADLPITKIETIRTPMSHRAWTPVSARLSLLEADGSVEEILAFDESDDKHRTLLPSYAPNANIEGRVVLQPNDVRPGDILLTQSSFGPAVRRAKQRQAGGVLMHRIAKYNVDPTGANRHLDAIRYSRVPTNTTLPVGQVSKRAYDRIAQKVLAGDTVRVRFEAKVKWDERPLRTLVLTFIGESRPDEVIPIACHVQEPGAVDNASGVGGFTAGAIALHRLIREGKIPRPQRSVAIVWGLEMKQSRIYLDHTKRKVLAALSADMIGASRERTGAGPLLEREPDPGAIYLLPPDRHTPWGAGRVTRDRLIPSGLSVIARCALLDVAEAEGGWATEEHPWEGGSDHDIFLRRGIPALLLWNFTDFAYHTSLDRFEHIDSVTLKRMTCAILAAALAVADLRRGDVSRYSASLSLERDVRLQAAAKASEADATEAWTEWFEGAHRWLEDSVID